MPCSVQSMLDHPALIDEFFVLLFDHPGMFIGRGVVRCPCLFLIFGGFTQGPLRLSGEDRGSPRHFPAVADWNPLGSEGVEEPARVGVPCCFQVRVEQAELQPIPEVRGLPVGLEALKLASEI